MGRGYELNFLNGLNCSNYFRSDSAISDSRRESLMQTQKSKIGSLAVVIFAMRLSESLINHRVR